LDPIIQFFSKTRVSIVSKGLLFLGFVALKAT